MAQTAQSTAGIKLCYAIEATAGSLPTTFTEIAGIVDMPSYDAPRAGLDWTPISETLSHKYIPGLKDGGDSWTLTANMSESLISMWNTLATSAASSFASGKQTWFACVVPNWTNSLYIAGIPNEVLWAGAGVDEVFQGDISITVTDASKGWAAKPTTIN